MTQLDLAKRVGVRAPTISQYERGDRDPDTDTLVRLAEALGVTTDYLAGRSQEPALAQMLYEQGLSSEDVGALLAYIAAKRMLTEPDRAIVLTMADLQRIPETLVADLRSEQATAESLEGDLDPQGRDLIARVIIATRKAVLQWQQERGRD